MAWGVLRVSVISEIKMGIAVFPWATIWSTILEAQYSLSCRRPFARHMPSASSNFRSANLFGVCSAVWLAAIGIAKVASTRTISIENARLFFAMLAPNLRAAIAALLLCHG